MRNTLDSKSEKLKPKRMLENVVRMVFKSNVLSSTLTTGASQCGLRKFERQSFKNL